ncbi:MAG: PKD domain-containing protein [Bacteroidota bacterium]|nr:PKD domain-containing protein [Bacteroidota bacterium]
MKFAYLLLCTSLLLGACQHSTEDQPAPKPVAGFMTPAAVGINTSFTVQNTSANANTYVWNWGDGSTPSVDASPSHVFNRVSTFRIRLQATGPGGVDTLSKLIQVNPNRPVAAFDIPATADTNMPVQVQNRTTDATSYLWTWGDGTTATDASPSHSWAKLGYYRVRLQATGPSGVDTLSKVVNVNRISPPALGPIVGKYSGYFYYDTNGPGPGTNHSEGKSTEQLSIVGSNSLLFRGQTLIFAPAATYWAGHAPQRNHYDFTATNGPYATIKLQVEQTGDSIYYNNSFIAAGGTIIYRYYGKRVP